MPNNPLDSALNRRSVAPDPAADKDETAPIFSADAGTDRSIEERLARDPESQDARLDRALDESMDASDPPASVQPVHNHQIPQSSGYDAEAEARRNKTRGDDKRLIDKASSKPDLG